MSDEPDDGDRPAASGGGPLDFARLRRKLDEAEGAEYWRSLEELADTDAFREHLHREFPAGASEWLDEVSRRRFLRLMGASLALAGVTGCAGQPDERIVPYVTRPEEVVPGEPRRYATATSLGGYATGVLVESHGGRPTRIEGNPDHPTSRGAADVFSQASVLGLYDPNRSKVVKRAGRISTWQGFLGSLQASMALQREGGGSGLRILTGAVTSPTLTHQLRRLLDQFPDARWHTWEPTGRDASRRGSRLAFGRVVDTLYRLDDADVVVSLDGDLLTGRPGSLRHAREFADRRRVRRGEAEMNRLYAVESTPTITGAMADHRLAARPSRVVALARSLATAVGVPDELLGSIRRGAAVAARDDGDRRRGGAESGDGGGAGATGDEAERGAVGGRRDGGDGLSGEEGAFVEAVAADLRRHPGTAAVVPGEYQLPEVHALAHAINHVLDNVGDTVVHVEPVEAAPVDHLASLRQLTVEMKDGAVDVLAILGANPVYSAPTDLDFAGALEEVDLRIHLGLYQDETAELCHWHIPRTHELESWSDARADDGTVSIVQPLIEPLYAGRSEHQLLAALMGSPERDAHTVVRETWRSQLEAAGGGEEFDRHWKRALREGVIPGTEAAPVEVTLQARSASASAASDGLDAVADRRGAEGRDESGAPGDDDGRPDDSRGTEATDRISPASAGSPGEKEEEDGLEAIFRPDPGVHDGRFANNGWLQELPRPLTKITWDNPVLMSPATAERLGLRNEDEVELGLGDRTARGAVWVVPGHADGAVTLRLGFGRRRSGRVGEGVGFDYYRLRSSGAPWFSRGLEVRATGDRYPLATTQDHHSMEDRHLVRHATLERFRRRPAFVDEVGHEPAAGETLYPEMLDGDYQWGMSVDLNVCIGCNACVIGCQAENNIPVVGKREVRRGREMHWIRIDRYWSGDLDRPDTWFQPVMCQHCENAPCEVVCPVAATTHSPEGLNEMTYNRCVGTRYCSNNCPYKVRRFNFLQYADYDTPVKELLNNPDVTVRTRGVMEKCTYCVQRINAARIDAKVEGREIRDGEVVTACQQACPTRAISFGDVSDPDTEVSRDKAEPHSYGILTELNTRPRTTYMARLRNPAPALDAEPSGHGGDGAGGDASGA